MEQRRRGMSLTPLHEMARMEEEKNTETFCSRVELSGSEGPLDDQKDYDLKECEATEYCDEYDYRMASLASSHCKSRHGN